VDNRERLGIGTVSRGGTSCTRAAKSGIRHRLRGCPLECSGHYTRRELALVEIPRKFENDILADKRLEVEDVVCRELTALAIFERDEKIAISITLILTVFNGYDKCFHRLL